MSTARAVPDESPGSGWRRHARRYRPLVGAIPALLLALVAIWEVVVIARAGADVPSDGDWQQASAAVRARHRDGDLILFAPDWIDPVGRLHLGDLIPVAMAGRMDAARYGRIWELSARGARAPETRGLHPSWQHAFGELEVRLFERTPAVVLTDFVSAFAPGMARGPAAVSLQEVGFQPHRCVLARPRPGGTVEVRYPAARLGAQLVGYVGLADVFTRRDDREPARLEVSVAGTTVADVIAGNDAGWVRFQAATTPGTAEVVFRASAGPNARNRLVCFAAEARQ